MLIKTEGLEGAVQDICTANGQIASYAGQQHGLSSDASDGVQTIGRICEDMLERSKMSLNKTEQVIGEIEGLRGLVTSFKH